MRILDSNTKLAWALERATRVEDGIVLNSDGKIAATVPGSGKLSFKIVAKNISGSGGLRIKLLDRDDNIILLKDLAFTNKAWAEKSLSFSISDKFKNSKLEIFRPKNSFGRIQVGRIIVEGTGAVPTVKKVEKLFSKKILSTIESPRRLAVIIPYGIYGGAEVYLKNIFSNLENPFVTDFVYLSSNTLESKITNPKINHLKVKSAQKVRAILISNNYDIIVFYNSKKVYELLSTLKADNIIRSEVVEIYHSNFEWGDSVSSLKERSGVDKIFRISDTLCEDISGVKKKYTIPVGIDTEHFKKRRSGSDSSSIVNFGLIARLSPEKNIKYAIDLFEKSSERNLTIVGGGPLMAELGTYVKDKNIKNVTLTGQKENVVDYYNTFDAFILTSKMEGTPISILEAMSFGIPIFSTDVGEIRANFGHLDNFYFLTGDLTEDKNILSTYSEKKCFFSNLREYVVEHHNSELNSNLFFNILLKNTLLTVPADPEKVMLVGAFY